MNILSIIKGENLRQRKKLSIFIIAFVFLFWALRGFISLYNGMQNLAVENPSSRDALQAIFSTKMVLTTVGNFTLSGWGSGLFIFLGAF